MLRGVLNAVPVDLLMIVTASFAFGVVLLAVWLVRRWVLATREGFHAEISAPMLGVAATLFGFGWHSSSSSGIRTFSMRMQA
jgi:hypothetical protein